MKKIILLALTVLMMVGCDKISNEIEEMEKARQTTNTSIREWHNQVVIIDSCEYISEGIRGLVEHKGNCRFCAKRRKQELEALVEQLKKNR